MELSRRSFLRLLGFSAAATVIAVTIPEVIIAQPQASSYKFSRYTLGDVIQREMIDNDMYGMLTRWADAKSVKIPISSFV